MIARIFRVCESIQNEGRGIEHGACMLRHDGMKPVRNIPGNFAVAAIIITMSITAAFATPPAIIAGGTVRTAGGDLLRGGSLHISKSYSANANTWGMSPANLRLWRDQLHYNTIRLNCLDGRAVADGRPSAAFSTIAEEAALADQVINNAESLGIYIILDYHVGSPVWDGSTWDIHNFWDFYAPRYKDKPFVIYEMYNESFGSLPDQNTTNQIVDLYKNHIRKWAPNTIVLGVEPVDVHVDWASYLKGAYTQAMGIDWTKGKDAFPYHCYGGDTALVLAVQAAGIPVINTEFSYPEDGWHNGINDGCHLPAQWCERHHISWMDWMSWNKADQSARINWIIPDATGKGWAWWTGTVSVDRPKTATPAPDFVTHAATMVQPNGRIVNGRVRDERHFRLRLWPDTQRKTAQ